MIVIVQDKRNQNGLLIRNRSLVRYVSDATIQRWLAVGRSRKCQGRGRVGRGWFRLRKVCRSDSRLASRRRRGRRLEPPLSVNARCAPCGPIVIAHMLACISVSLYCFRLLPARQQQTFITTDYAGITMPYLLRTSSQLPPLCCGVVYYCHPFLCHK